MRIQVTSEKVFNFYFLLYPNIITKQLTQFNFNNYFIIVHVNYQFYSLLTFYISTLIIILDHLFYHINDCMLNKNKCHILF